MHPLRGVHSWDKYGNSKSSGELDQESPTTISFRNVVSC